MNPIGVKKKHIVFLPHDYVEEHYVGKLFGWRIASSGVFNVAVQEVADTSLIGEIFDAKPNVIESDCLIGWWDNEKLRFQFKETEYSFEEYDIFSSVFSRNEGILESRELQDVCAIISGCGSVGSLVALELARSGVGHFVLIDNDIVQYHNLCRHQCDIADVGKYKVDALAERIKRIQPRAEIKTSVSVIEQTPKSIFQEYGCDRNSIIVGCADNREADVYANFLAATCEIPFISIGFWERAFAGEIFYYIPNRGMPCYECAIGSTELSARTQANHRFYTIQEDIEKTNFEPGISVDINFVTNIGIKLILDLVNIGNENYTQRLLPHLKQFTLVCNTNNPNIGGEMAEIFAYPLQVTTSLQVGFGSQCKGKCNYEDS